ncbi:PSP1 C-terminal domain-containing protein, partial [Sporosarcina sp. NCCP-2222]|uniref:PSP1 C-terminal domain-containing protein n=1 Tax=Sporosarcina sp. NCCP-2222 TaxID=2935073 RepID=UPI0024A6A165
MYKIVGVRFKKAGKIYYFDPLDYQLEIGDYVIVETTRGIEYGKVASRVREVEENDVVLPLKKIIRVAQPDDIEQVEENRQEAERAFGTCMEKIREHQLDMKL